MSADCIRRRCDGSLFHTRESAVAKERSPNDDSVRGTATVVDSADLRPVLVLAAANGVIIYQVGWCIAVQTTMNNHTQLVLDALLNRKPVAISQQGGHAITSRWAGDQTYGCVKNGLQTLNVASWKTSKNNVAVYWLFVEVVVGFCWPGKGCFDTMPCSDSVECEPVEAVPAI